MSKAITSHKPRSADESDVALGKLIRKVRIAKGVSQIKLGEALGVTFQQVQKYEKGTNRISQSRLGDIAKALETPISYFIKDKGKVDPKLEALDQFASTREGQEFITEFLKVNSSKRAVVTRSLIEVLKGMQ